ncbi:hypothetical protein ACWEK2_03900 [Streptomyces albidoflavus]
MTTIATPPAAALDALLDRLSAGKPLTSDEAAMLRAGVTGLRRTAGGLQRRSQQQAARISELESEAGELRQLADAPRLSPATCSCGGRGISHLHADVHQPIAAAQQPPLRDRLAAAIRAAACPGCCPVPHACHLTRPQPTLWDQDGRVLEVAISGPIDRVAAIIAGALAGPAADLPAA